MIVFGIQCNIFNVLFIHPKTCRSNGFLFFCKAKFVRLKNRASFRDFMPPRELDRHRAYNLSRYV